jgi:hypothetical protein
MVGIIESAGKATAGPWSRGGRAQRRPSRVAGVLGVAVALALALSACTSVDSAEAVWFQPIVAPAGTRIVLSGRFPDARYASFSVYTASGGYLTSNGVGASLPGYRITPQPGSVNPWQREAAPGGRFTLVIGSEPSPGQPNTLPLPGGTTSEHPGYLVYRVYLPAGGSFSDVPIPTVMVDQGGAAHTIPACPLATIVSKGPQACP